MRLVSVIILGYIIQVLGCMFIEICDPSRLFVEVASFLALEVVQPHFPQIFEYIDSLTITFLRRITFISQDTL